jgi:hypothetical protein
VRELVLAQDLASLVTQRLFLAASPQVPDCGFDLTESTYYLKRHRVCEAHMKAKTVELDGNICR